MRRQLLQQRLYWHGWHGEWRGMLVLTKYWQHRLQHSLWYIMKLAHFPRHNRALLFTPASCLLQAAKHGPS
jgi:hypothetical protein